MISINAAKKAEIDAKRDEVPEGNADAQAERRRAKAKEDINKLAEKGDLASVAAALKKVLEVLP